jgi:hypothetical protein
MQSISDFKCPYIDKSEIWKRAEKFRDDYWPESALPVDFEKIIEKRLRLDIEPQHKLLDDLDIDAYLKKDLSGIVVDYKCYMDERFMNRLRFSYAHEVGHLILHRDLYSQFPIDDLSSWKKFIYEVPDREYGFIEYQANEFAGRVLVPKKRLVAELSSCIQQIKNAGLFDYMKSNPDAVLSSISQTLCKPFGVSSQVMERRVEREGLWPPEV